MESLDSEVHEAQGMRLVLLDETSFLLGDLATVIERKVNAV